MSKKILPVYMSFVVISATLFTNIASAQSNFIPGEELEKIFSFWSSRMEMARAEVGADKKEFDWFTRFYAHQIDSMHTDFIQKVNNKTITVANAMKVMDEKEKYFISLYHKFIEIKQEYPSSVDEYRERRSRLGVHDSCFPSCYNTSFQDGTLDGWYGYYAVNSSPALGPFNITGITGGYCGSVVRAGGPDINISPTDYQIRITGGAATDYFLNTYGTTTIPQVSPWGSGYSVMIGDSDHNGAQAAILSQSFLVAAGTASLTYQYAVFLEHPPTGHSYYQQPFFLVAVLDQNGDTIPICGKYSQSAISAGEKGFNKTFYPVEGDTVYWRPWTIVNVPLKNYIGQCVTILFQVWDCSLGGHFAYAYVDATCSPLVPITSSPNLCGQDSISLTAPPGDSSYKWSGPKNGIRGDSTSQVVWVDSAGTYSVITIPVTGVTCADTLSITIGKSPGPPPHPGFKADTVCAGRLTHFHNTSNDTTTAKFYWDFYDVGIYNDSNIIDPTWAFASPGIYTVKLHEVFNGCGTDTLIKVKVDSVVNGGFTFSSTCAGIIVTMTNTSKGANGYFWNYGDPPSGTLDTSSAFNGSHTYINPGTYTVTLIAKNGGPCPDTLKQPITIYAYPHPVITGLDSICPSYHDTLTVHNGNGTNYSWSGGNFIDSNRIWVAPSATRTFTVIASNFTCTHDTTFTVTVISPAAAIIAEYDSVCSGNPDTLKGFGGTTYKWSNSSTSSAIIVNPTVQSTYTLYATSGTCRDSTTVTIGIVKQVNDAIVLNPDSICAGTPTSLTAVPTGGGFRSYKWNTGATTNQITVSPESNTTYTVYAQGTCNKDSVTKTVHVIPLPTPVISGRLLICKGFGDTLTVTGGATFLWNNGSTKNSYIIKQVNGDSTLTVKVSNGKCDSTVSVKVTEKFPPPVSILPVIVCSQQCVALHDIDSATGYTYIWNNGATGTVASAVVCPDSTTTYSLTVSNGCITQKTALVDVYSPSLYACCDQTIARGDTALLTANSAATYNWTPSTGLSCDTCRNVKATPTVTTTYTVSGIDANGCTDLRVITVTIDVPCFDFKVPNVFTPNNAGAGNDNEFYIKTRNIDGWSILIYDRWGKEMYNSTNPYQYWQGTTESGAKASDGVYYYIIKASCQGTNYTKEGYVQLIR